MPRFDGTGPRGLGPFTGRGLGPCGQGRGFGRQGFGRGFGWRSPIYQPDFEQPVELSKEQQIKILEAELKEIEAEKKAISEKLKELKK